MRTVRLAALFALPLLWVSSARAAVDCEPFRCDPELRGSIVAQCPCPEASNHGRYVSCVARFVKQLADNGAIPKTCKGKIKRCAARSTCGKEGAVTCHVPILGDCDTTAGTCVDNPAVPCTSDAECVIGSRCKIKRSADVCLARGGTVGTETSCCAVCGAP